MCDQPTTLTLLEDWQTRRERLLAEPGPVGQHADALIRVLDFLIERYRDSPEAARPARAPADTGVFFDQRATVVLDHLWEGRVGGVKTTIQAAHRVGAIAHRLAAHATGSFDDDPNQRSPQYRVTPPLHDVPWRPHPRFGPILRLAIRFGYKPHKFIYRALVYINPTASNEVLQYLTDRLNDPLATDVEAVDLLALCDNRYASRLAFRAWRLRLESGGRDPVTDRIEELFLARRAPCEKGGSGRPLDAIRNELAARDAVVRLRAIELIKRFGTLDDVGLLLDLLRLPRQEDEASDERSAIVRAIETISRRIASS